MEYQLLGGTGVMVSPLCFGTVSFGDVANEATSKVMSFMVGSLQSVIIPGK